MIIIECVASGPRPPERRFVALFGQGLIGRCIVTALLRNGFSKPLNFPFTWDERGAWARQLGALERHIRSDGRSRNAGPTVSRIDTIWSAGRSGFNASGDEAAAELAAFGEVLAFSGRLQDASPHAHHAFHLMSSAGGLYNGQRHVDGTNAPRPTNPYGIAKLEQENRLRRALPQVQKMIYRPSSVYGFSGFGTRVGLIAALMQSSIRRRTARIYGSPHTIRDYVLNTDVGDFIGRRLASPDRHSETFILASGKPSAIFEVLHKVARIMGRPLYCNFENVQSNADDMSFAQSALPPSWRPTDLETGIRQTARRLTAISVSPPQRDRI